MMAVSPEKRNVLLLAGAQSLYQTAAVLVLTLSALVGQMLADDKSLVTLPVAVMVAATATLMIPAAFFMQRYGRRAGFVLGILLGGISGLLAAYAITHGDFWLFVTSAAFMGGYQSCAQYYRFAAADAASGDFKSRAISWVIAGGVIAAIVGPNLARYTRDIGSTPFVAAYLALASLSLIALLLAALLRLPPPVAIAQTASPRPLRQIMAQPVFLTALTGSSIGFGVMTMIMTATPLAMQFCGQPLGAATTVIQWHVLGMFVPSFFTGDLIRRYGVLRIMSWGAGLLIANTLVALLGNSYAHFLSGLTLLGIGWNFLFIGSTTLLVQAYRPGEQARTQAAHDFLMFTIVSLSSFSAGHLFSTYGWQTVNAVTLPFLALVLIVVNGLARQQRQA